MLVQSISIVYLRNCFVKLSSHSSEEKQFAAGRTVFVHNKYINCANQLCLPQGMRSNLDEISYYNSSSVCLCVRFLSPPRSFDGSSPNLVGVCRWTSHLPLRGSFSKRSMGRRVKGLLSLSTILYMRQPHPTQLQKAPFALLLLHLRV